MCCADFIFPSDCVEHGYQNPDLDPMILRFYDPTCPKQSGFFKNLCNCSRSVGSYDSNDPK